jgi:hypothetical protein
LVAATLTAAPQSADAQGVVGPTSAVPDPQVAVDELDPVPVAMWGVSGQDPDSTQTPSVEVLVWDFQQIGDRLFVGGAFLNVQESRFSAPIAQRSVAAFDVNTGEWISTWTPEFDRAVYSLALSPSGSLLVGGEFEQVNGQDRAGLVALDPLTGAIDPTFEGSVDRPWSDNRAQVRQIRVVDQQIYVAGNFSHLNGADGTRTRAYRAGRFLSPSGVLDENWKPEVTGSGVWGMAVDPDRGQVHLTGFFSGVNGEPDTGHVHTVDDQTGASVPDLAARVRNFPAIQPEMYDVAVGDDLVFVAGEQHLVQVLDADTQNMVGFHHTGLTEDRFELGGIDEIFAGGAFQVAERIGDVVIVGCHCTYSVRDGLYSHYSSFSDTRTPHRLVMAYDAATGELIEEFLPDLHSPQDGVWAVGSDTNGCLYVGGDLHVGGVDHDNSRWLGGFGKLCPRVSTAASTGNLDLGLSGVSGCITLSGSFQTGSETVGGVVLGAADRIVIRDLALGTTEQYGLGNDTRCLPARSIGHPDESDGGAFETRYQLTWSNLAQQRNGLRRGELPVLDTAVSVSDGELPEVTVSFSRLVTGSLPVGTVELPSGDADRDGVSNGDEARFLASFADPGQVPVDYASDDIDGDGILDADEPGFPSIAADLDGDTRPNWADRDSNGDGVDDRGDTAAARQESFHTDVDGDGILNWLDADPFVAASGPTASACAIPIPASAFQARVAANPTAAQVWRLYSAVFLRQPDETGYNYWLGIRDSGYDHAAIANDFQRSTEFVARYGQLTDAAFVEQIYANVLCRLPDAVGRDYWISQLDGGLTRGELVLWFTEGQEYLARTGTGFALAS